MISMIRSNNLRSRTRGRSSVKGTKVVSKASAKTTACRGSSRSSSLVFDFCAGAPFFALGGMLSVEETVGCIEKHLELSARYTKLILKCWHDSCAQKLKFALGSQQVCM